jgi:rhodanese-related sulfurtransferase
MARYVINVLSPEVYQDCHIKGTINVPHDRLADFVQNLPKDTEIIVYCAHYQCPLSKQSAHLLMNLGFTNVKAYEGGIVEWYQDGLPVEGRCQMEFLQQRHQKQESDPRVPEISEEELQRKLEINA